MRKYLDDGCKWCGSQEYLEDYSDVTHYSDCPAPLLLQLAQLHATSGSTAYPISMQRIDPLPAICRAAAELVADKVA